MQAAREGEAQTRALLDELEAARRQESDGEREARVRIAELEAEAEWRQQARGSPHPTLALRGAHRGSTAR